MAESIPHDIYYISRDGSVTWGDTKPGDDENENVKYFEAFSHLQKQTGPDPEKYKVATDHGIMASESRVTLM